MRFPKSHWITLVLVLIARQLLLAGTPEAGRLESVSETGIVKGSVAPAANTEPGVKVLLYIDGPIDKPGTRLFFEVMAKGGFEAPIPEAIGDGKSHTLYGYAVSGTRPPELLAGSPLSFQFKSRPPATLKILSPKPNQVLSGNNVVIKYKVSGDQSKIRHAHWRLDDGPEMMDMDFNGAFKLSDVRPGSHVVNGFLAYGHHEKVLNTEVSVRFDTTLQNNKK